MAKIEVHPLELVYPRSLKRLSGKMMELIHKKLWLKVLVGAFFGIITGLILGPTFGKIDPELAKIIAEWLALPGTIFLGVIQMIVIPLIFASIIRGIASTENIEQLKKTGILIAGYFILTTTIAILIGILLATIIQPGNYVNAESLKMNSEIAEVNKNVTVPGLEDIPGIVGTILPINLVGSALNVEMLQIVIFAIIFGVALVNLKPDHSKSLLELLGALQEVCMTIVKWAMLLAPLAVYGLMAKLTSQLGIEVLIGVSVYMATVILGLFFLMIFYLGIIYFIGKTNPLEFLENIRDVQVQLEYLLQALQ